MWVGQEQSHNESFGQEGLDLCLPLLSAVLDAAMGFFKNISFLKCPHW